jgi:hypothetical protein
MMMLGISRGRRVRIDAASGGFLAKVRLGMTDMIGSVTPLVSQLT